MSVQIGDYADVKIQSTVIAELLQKNGNRLKSNHICELIELDDYTYLIIDNYTIYGYRDDYDGADEDFRRLINL